MGGGCFWHGACLGGDKRRYARASSADLSGAPAVRARGNVNYEKYETRSTTRTYDVKDGADLYYTQPASRSALYKQYDNSARRTGSATTTRNVRTTRAETVRRELKRKYYLAHPFSSR